MNRGVLWPPARSARTRPAFRCEVERLTDGRVLADLVRITNLDLSPFRAFSAIWERQFGISSVGQIFTPVYDFWDFL
jgi:hypothetical protein